ncbi:MAG: hypothetical protein K8F25_02780 [Fimbriimonadaceae bacterium]|nr:hypothetical protein [Alphaproteobacteria bacterium]
MILSALSWLGRQGTKGVAIGVFLGISVPQLAAFFRPWLAMTVFAILLISMVRVDLAQMRILTRNPTVLILSTFFMMVVTPLVTGYGLLIAGIWDSYPEIALGLMIMASAPPLVSAPALVYMIGLNGPLALASLLACILVTPITVPLIMALFAPAELAVSPSFLAIQLFMMIAGGILLAALIRRLVGDEKITANSDRLDGLSIIAMVIFAISFMDGVGFALIEKPGLILTLIGLSFLVSILFILIFMGIMWWRGKTIALTVGVVNGNRSVGLVVAAMAGAVPELTWIYCAIAQFPVYLLPQVIKMIARRMKIVP